MSHRIVSDLSELVSSADFTGFIDNAFSKRCTFRYANSNIPYQTINGTRPYFVLNMESAAWYELRNSIRRNATRNDNSLDNIYDIYSDLFGSVLFYAIPDIVEDIRSVVNNMRSYRIIWNGKNYFTLSLTETGLQELSEHNNNNRLITG